MCVSSVIESLLYRLPNTVSKYRLSHEVEVAMEFITRGVKHQGR